MWLTLVLLLLSPCSCLTRDSIVQELMFSKHLPTDVTESGCNPFLGAGPLLGRPPAGIPAVGSESRGGRPPGGWQALDTGQSKSCLHLVLQKDSI